MRVGLLLIIGMNYIFAYSGYYAPYKIGTSQKVSQAYDGSLSHYGASNSPYAVDFSGKFDVYPPKNGIVDKVGTDSFKIPFCVNNPQHWHGSANYLRIKHNDGIYSYYFHLAQIDVKVGDKVTSGSTKLGVSGNTGCSTSEHLHLQFSKNPNMTRASSLKIKFEDIGYPSKGNSYKSQNNDSSCTNFSDISTNKYKNEICTIAKEKIVNGYSDGTYQPDKAINRAEFTKILVETVEKDKAKIKKFENTNCGFSDVPKNSWFSKYVCYAKNNNIINGYSDGKFRGAKTINFAEASKIIVNTLLTKVSKKEEADADYWYSPYINQLKLKNIDTQISIPSKLLNRAETAHIIVKVKGL